MPGQKFDTSKKFRDWVEQAIDAGNKTPAQVALWIDQNVNENEIPTLPTVSRIMRDMGYVHLKSSWVKKGK